MILGNRAELVVAEVTANFSLLNVSIIGFSSSYLETANETIRNAGPIGFQRPPAQDQLPKWRNANKCKQWIYVTARLPEFFFLPSVSRYYY